MNKFKNPSVAGLWPYAAKAVCAETDTFAPSRHEMLARRTMVKRVVGH
ncbi:MAG: hypothetical protein WBK91_00230 [Alphaproteobacteria bacterium]